MTAHALPVIWLCTWCWATSYEHWQGRCHDEDQKNHHPNPYHICSAIQEEHRLPGPVETLAKFWVSKRESNSTLNYYIFFFGANNIQEYTNLCKLGSFNLVLECMQIFAEIRFWNCHGPSFPLKWLFPNSFTLTRGSNMATYKKRNVYAQYQNISARAACLRSIKSFCTTTYKAC